jgi:hypothetical protein
MTAVGPEGDAVITPGYDPVTAVSRLYHGRA